MFFLFCYSSRCSLPDGQRSPKNLCTTWPVQALEGHFRKVLLLLGQGEERFNSKLAVRAENQQCKYITDLCL